MATVTGITAERAAEIENASVVGGRIDEDGTIILMHPDGAESAIGNINTDTNDATVNVRDFGAIGDGVTDDTIAVNAAATAAKTAGSRLFFPNGTYLVEAPILIQDTSDFRIDMQGRLKRKAGSAANSLLYFKNVSGIDASVIRTHGNVLNNQKAQSDTIVYPVDEAKHDVRVENCTDVTISLLDSKDPAGDSIYVVGASSRVQIGHVNSVSGQSSGRNAVSLIDCSGVSISTVYSENTGCSTGVIAMPGGVDIEPNAGQLVSDVTIGEAIVNTSGTCGLGVFGAYTVGGVRQINRVKINSAILIKGPGVKTSASDMPIRGVNDLTIGSVSILQDSAATNQAFSIDDCDNVSIHVDVPNSRGALAPTIGATAAVTNLDLRGRINQSGGHCFNVYRLNDSVVDMKLKSPTSGVLVVKQASGTDSTNVLFKGDWRRVSGAAAIQANGPVEWTVEADVTGWTGSQRAIGTYASGAIFGVDRYIGNTLVSQGAAWDATATTTALNAFLATSTALGVKRLVGSFTVNNVVTIPANTYLDLTSATITQSGSSKVTFTAASGVSILGGTIIGKGTDYVAGVASPTAIGLDVTGSGVRVSGTKFVQHAGAAVRGTNAAGLRLDRVSVVGVGGITTIPAVDPACYGIYLNSGCTDVSVNNLDLTDLSIGFIASTDSAFLTLSNIRIDRIPGQHGIYLQCATGLKVDGVRAANVWLNGLKVQLANTSSADSLGFSIANVVGHTCGDTVLLLNNTNTTMATAKKFKGGTITNVAGYSCNRVLYLGSVFGCTVAGVTGYNTTQQVVTILDCQDLLIEGIASSICGREIVLFSNAAAVASTGSATQRVTIRGIRGYNACNENNATYGAAIAVGGAAASTDQKDIMLDGIEIDADNGFMRYGMSVHSTAPQDTLRVRNAKFRGFSTNPATLAGATKAIGEWSNVDATTTIANFPSGLPTRIGTIGNKTRWACNALPTSGVFQQGDVVHNSAPTAGATPGWVLVGAGGLHGGSWAASTAYAVGDWRRTASGKILECTTAGTSGTVEPAPTTINEVVVDGTVTWVYRASGIAVAKAMASIAA
jgi:hypothetical protein